MVEDADARGLSWARNRGLERATGDAVFFVDADDTVRRGFIPELLALLESTGADFALSSFDYAPLKRGYDLRGNASVRAAMLSAFFGYSFDDVRRWNRGGRLDELREQGSVCRAAFRRDFLERWQLRFDENLFLYEDAPFLAECACRAERTVSTAAVYYDYTPGENGILATSPRGSARYWRYKFAALANRKAIAARVGGDALEHFRGSAALTALEFLSAGRLLDFARYAADAFVFKSLLKFPWSISKILSGARGL